MPHHREPRTRRSAPSPSGRRLTVLVAGALLLVFLPLWFFRGGAAHPTPSPAGVEEPGASEDPALESEADAATGREASRPRAAANEATPPPEPVPAPPRAPSIEVVLTFDEPPLDGEPVLGVVRLVPRFKTRIGRPEKSVDAAGHALFAGLPTGTYRVEVVEGSVREGYLAPWRQETVSSADNLPGNYGRRVDLERGAHERVEVLIQKARVIRGYVLGPDGAGVSDIPVRIQSKIGGLNALRQDSRTDATGYFEFSGVYPGVYAPQVAPDSAEDLGFLRGLPRPYPERIDVREVLAADVTLELADGPVTVVGEVFDQDGEPFPDLEVLAFYAGAPGDETAFNWGDLVKLGRTSSRGEYRLEGMPARRVKIQIEPYGSLRDPEPGKIKLGTHVPIIRLDLRGRSGLVRAEDRTAMRSRPFTVRGRVLLDPAWQARHRVEPSDLKVKVFLVDPEVARRMNRIASAIRAKLEPDGTFAWQCESTRDVAIMEITARTPDRPSKRAEFTPMENEEVEVLITFPGK